MPYPDLPHIAQNAVSDDASVEIRNCWKHLDRELAREWEIMRRFCTLVNLASSTSRRLPLDILLTTMASVMYRLLRKTYEKGSADEALRLGMLAFCSHVFLQWHNIRLPYRHFSKSYTYCLAKLECPSKVSPRILLWLLAIGRISVFTTHDDHWLESSLQFFIEQCSVDSWIQMRAAVKSFLWIDFLYDKPCRDFYKLTQQKENHTVTY